MPIRRPNRLTDYDYSQNNAYFITLCVEKRVQLLGEIKFNDDVVGANCVRPSLSSIGQIIENEILSFNSIYEFVYIGKYVIMPNHIHMIIIIDREGRTQFAPTISTIVKQFKGSITKQIGKSIWQKSFYDHIIRNQKDYDRVWQYIENNPFEWELDEYYSD